MTHQNRTHPANCRILVSILTLVVAAAGCGRPFDPGAPNFVMAVRWTSMTHVDLHLVVCFGEPLTASLTIDERPMPWLRAPDLSTTKRGEEVIVSAEIAAEETGDSFSVWLETSSGSATATGALRTTPDAAVVGSDGVEGPRADWVKQAIGVCEGWGE